MYGRWTATRKVAVTIPDDIDDMIRERIQAELAERQQRRERMRAVRRDFDRRRHYAKTKINRERARRT